MSYQNFLNRLQQLQRSKNYPQALLARIKKEDLDTILLAIINDSSLEDLINQANPVPAIRLAKELSGLCRSVSLLRAPDGEFQCILETENLNADNQICEVEQFDGLIKKGTTAWRLDGAEGPCEYASLEIKFSTAKKLNLKTKAFKDAFAERQKEINFTWGFPENDYILRSVMGAPFSNDNGSFLSIYAPYGIRLDDLDTRMSLTQEQQNQIVSATLATLVFLEQNEIVHQDIKSANLLVFIDANKRFKVKLIDFDAICFAKNKDFQHALYATVGYESPEIAFIMANPSMSAHEEYEAVYAEDGKTFAKHCADKLAQIFAQDKKSKHKAYLKPDHKNDVWSCAIALHEFLNNGNAPSFLPLAPLFKGMMAPDRENRLTATMAAQCWEQQLQQQQASTPVITVNFHAPSIVYVPQYRAHTQSFGPTYYYDKIAAFAVESIEKAKRWLRSA